MLTDIYLETKLIGPQKINLEKRFLAFRMSPIWGVKLFSINQDDSRQKIFIFRGHLQAMVFLNASPTNFLWCEKMESLWFGIRCWASDSITKTNATKKYKKIM